MAMMGLNLGMMYTEDTYEVPGQPYFGYQRGVIPQTSCGRWMIMPICWASSFVPASRRWAI